MFGEGSFLFGSALSLGGGGFVGWLGGFNLVQKCDLLWCNSFSARSRHGKEFKGFVDILHCRVLLGNGAEVIFFQYKPEIFPIQGYFQELTIIDLCDSCLTFNGTQILGCRRDTKSKLCPFPIVAISHRVVVAAKW